MTNSNSALLALAERVEAATADQQRELFVEAYEAIFAPLDSFMRGEDDRRRIFFLRCIGDGAFLDAAMSLVDDQLVTVVMREALDKLDREFHPLDNFLTKLRLYVLAAALRARSAQ